MDVALSWHNFRCSLLSEWSHGILSFKGYHHQMMLLSAPHSLQQIFMVSSVSILSRDYSLTTDYLG